MQEEEVTSQDVKRKQSKHLRQKIGKSQKYVSFSVNQVLVLPKIPQELSAVQMIFILSAYDLENGQMQIDFTISCGITG